jgi:outer membrane beta-barrel protein
MKKTGVGLLVATALWLVPNYGWAQKAKAGASASTSASADTSGNADASASGDATATGDASATGGEATPGGEGVPGGEVPGGEGLEDICKIDPTACPNLDMDKEAARQFKEPLYAVQQIFALRVRRFELSPFWSITLNDQFVAHPGPGLNFNYYISNVLSVGLIGEYYEPFNEDRPFNAQVRRAARVAVPLTEYQWMGGVQVGYVFAYGKFAFLSDFIFQYDAYLVGGVGAISTRPIPVIDPDNRNFEYKVKVQGNAGIGLRVWVNRWLAINGELRDYLFNDQLENLTIAPTTAGQQDPSTWYDPNSHFTNNVQAQVGVSIFIPFSFDYRLPK